MKVLITGSQGQLGKSLSRVLDERGVEYLALSRNELDIRSTADVNLVMNRFRPQYLVNAAAFTNVDRAEIEGAECESINAVGPKILAGASERYGCTLIQISTDYVFDGKKNTPYLEEDVVNPINHYGRSKVLGEINVKDILKENFYILRTSWLYSEFGKNFAKTMIKKALASNEIVQVVTDQCGQPTFAGDLSNQIFEIMTKKPEWGVYNATSSGAASWFEFAKYIFEEIGEDGDRVQPITSKELQLTAERPRYTVLNQDKWQRNGMSPIQNWQKSTHDNIGLISQSLKG